MTSTQSCYCQSGQSYFGCCHPYIQKNKVAPTAEELMRSRFSAYVIQDYEYILNTYGQKQRAELSEFMLKQNSINTQWISLKVLKHLPKVTTAQVEFKAYYLVDKQYFVMHELSDFELVNGQWFYTTGTMLNETGEYKQGRNTPCLCISGKKFKKCCGK